MPPFIPQKRLATSPPPDEKPTSAKKPKGSEANSSPPQTARKASEKARHKFLSLDDDNSDSSLSSVDSDEFEDVESKVTRGKPTSSKIATEGSSDESDEDVEWENAIPQQPERYIPKGPAKVSGDIQITIDPDDDDFGGFAAASGKKKQGLSKTERETRLVSHQLHVQFLLWHNAVRNNWLLDATVQKTLVDQLPSQVRKEVDKWKRASGLEAAEGKKPKIKKQKGSKGKQVNDRDERDWGRPSQRLETGKADLSSGDPLIPLLKILSAYWNKRFAITMPGLRKRGYSTRLERRKEVNSFKAGPHDPEKHGERIRGIKEFRVLAKKCEGSRDVGAQLFTALLRGLGIEARLVASLQPAGFGATKLEDMVSEKDPVRPAKKPTPAPDTGPDSKTNPEKKKASAENAQKSYKARNQKAQTIDLSSGSEDSDDSVVDITPSMPKKRPARYDREVPYPIYWTEAISPITTKVYPVSPLVLDKAVATNDDMLSSFEPRGAKADSVRLVMAYVVAYSSDRTAKDVTVRYLRKHIFPGKTKAFRMPIEKIPVYSKRGKVSRYEDYDWFKHTLSPYTRSDALRTAVDDLEDANELVPQVPEKKQVDDTVDTLGSLKASPDFVLERFLRREEAIRPGAKPDRKFISGKGENVKEEAVYRRSDVERCLTTESWHKEGRIPKLGEVPLKRVPVRAVTLTRKREAEEHERVTGEKQLQGLYSWDQTEYIVPAPIQDGIIPKNSYGNIDAFVPTMIPKGAVHLPMRGTVRICKKLEVDFAEAVVGFEFGNKRAVPVIQGVVVAKENEKNVKDAWKKWSEEQKKKEEMKVEKLVLDLWRKFIIGLRIRKRVQEQYGEDIDMAGSTEMPATLQMSGTKDEPIDLDDENDNGGGGFMPDEPLQAEGSAPAGSDGGGGFFLDHSDEERSEPDELIMEDHNEDSQTLVSRKGKQRKENEIAQYPTPATTEFTPRDESEELAEDDDRAAAQGRNELLDGRSEVDDSGSTTGDDIRSDSSLSEAESDESEEYNPVATRSSNRTPATQPRRTSGRTTRSDGQLVEDSPDPQQAQKSKTNVEIVIPARRADATPTRKARTTQATSPYFEQPSTGRSRRSKK